MLPRAQVGTPGTEGGCCTALSELGPTASASLGDGYLGLAGV